MSRAEWFARQLLGSTERFTIADVIRQAGWMHAAGGTGPYLSLRARIGEVRRKDIDDAIFGGVEVVEVPAARDSTMLVARDDVAIALAAGRRAFEERLDALEKKSGEVRRGLVPLQERICEIVGQSAAVPDTLRRACEDLIRDLGKAGRDLGFPTTLPVALRALQIEAKVIRVPVEGRLDAKRYLYRAWPESLNVAPFSGDEASLDRELARRFLEWAAPATVVDFAWWSGIGKRQAERALASVRVEAVTARKRQRRSVTFLPFRDNYFNLHRGVAAFLDQPRGVVLDYSNKPVSIDRLESLHHNAILVGDELRGIWEFDHESERVIWRLLKPGREREIEREGERLSDFIRRELGDHLFYAFDTTRARERRIEFVRGLSLC